MSHFRQLTSSTQGPITMELEGNTLNFVVVLDPARSNVSAELSTRGDRNSEEAKLIDTARLEQTRNGLKLVVDVPDNVTIMGGGSSVNINSNVIVGGGVQVAYGRNGYSSGHGKTLVLEHGIDVKVYIPEASDILISGGTGVGLSASGRAGTIQVKTAGGNVDFGEALEVNIRASGGEVTGRYVWKSADIRTSGGDILLSDVGGSVQLRSSGADVEIDRLFGNGEIATSGGDIKIGIFHGQQLSLRTSSGNIQHPEHPGISARVSGGKINGKHSRGW